MKIISSINRVTSGRRSSRRRKTRGVAAAELAVCLPIIVLIVIASIEACSALFLKQSLTVAAYEGARTAIAHGSTIANAQAASAQILSDRHIQGAKVVFNPSDLAKSVPGDFVNVTVTAPCAPNSPVPATFYRGRTLSTTATFMIEE